MGQAIPGNHRQGSGLGGCLTFDLLTVTGTVTAPAGCGKTQLVADAATRHKGSKPLLLLTHTNAGATAMRRRLTGAGVAPRAYRVATLDGWCLRIVKRFPKRSGIDLADLAEEKINYTAVRKLAAALVESGALSDILRASYERVLVDEYQDCSMEQHRLVVALGGLLPVVVLGDPLQAIFGFGDTKLVDWDADVKASFGTVGELTTPWRWVKAGAPELGQWLLDIRPTLAANKKVNLQKVPKQVNWVKLKSKGDDEARIVAAAQDPPIPDGSVLVIGDTYAKTHDAFARASDGHVVENVNLGPLVTFADAFDVNDANALSALLLAASGVVDGLKGGQLLKDAVLSQTGKRKPATRVEELASQFLGKPSFAAARDVLTECAHVQGVRVHRPAVYEALCSAFNLAEAGVPLPDAARRLREEARWRGRLTPRRAVGSTLLLKGLEADAAVVLQPEDLSRKNLYVAMTRGSRSLTLCSVSADI